MFRRVSRPAIFWLLAAWVAGCGIAGHWYRPPLDRFLTIDLAGRARTLDRSTAAVLLVDVSVGDREKIAVIDRRTQARVVRKLADLGAWAVGLDMLHEEHRDAAEDRELESAIRENGRVVLASRYDPATLAEVPSIFRGSARDRGVVNLLVDPHDGYTRKVQHHYRHPGIETPYSFGIALVRYAQAAPPAPPPPVETGPAGFLMPRAGAPPLEVPADRDGLSLIQFQGPAGTIPVIGWKELLESRRADLDLTGKIVIVGNVQLEIQDAWLTPFNRGASSKLSGVEIHAQDVMGHLSQDLRRTAPREVAWLAGAATAVLGALVARTGSFALAVLLLAVLVGGGWAGPLHLFLSAGLFVNPLALMLPAALAFTVSRGAMLAAPPAPVVETEAELLAGADALLSSGQAGKALLRLQGAAGGGTPSERVRWALARTFAALGQPALAGHYLDDLALEAIAAEQLFEVAERLEAAGGIEQAIAIYSTIRRRDRNFREVEKRCQRLEEESRSLPDALRRHLGQRYSDVRLLGAGGMGRVYRAHDRERDRLVAIKIPDEVLLAVQGVAERFLREVNVLAELDHPNIIRLLDVSRSAPLYYTMEFVAGTDLAGMLETGTTLEPRDAIDLMLQVASALEAVHRAQLVHRDIKPANILVDEDGRVRLADFGLAFGADRTRLTTSGQHVGTLAYMAPEQLAAKDPDPTWDVYAFGVVLHQAIAGAPPFPGDQFWRKVTEAAPSLGAVRPDAHGALVALVDDCLSQVPAKRPRDGSALRTRLAAVAGELGRG